ncbi:MAG: LCP family protein [Clostridia bacterium]|nr:LCP family protein [Clostridia bacterium]MBO4428502.1 LCP family protein [Clostridia bacterium]
MEKNRTWNIDLVLTLVALVLLFASVLVVLGFLFAGKNAVPTSGDIPLNDGRKKGYYTFVIAGLDKVSNNTDVLMLASLDTVNRTVSIIQIPRDTYIDPSVTGYTSVMRVNAIYAAEYNKARNDDLSVLNSQRAGMRKLSGVLAEAFCTEIDDYFLIDISIFKSVVDAVGGVWFDVPEDMFYEDPYQDLYIDLKAGYQLLDGDKAEQLVRYRGYASADIGRINMRADFMKEMARQVKANLNLSSVITIVSEVLDKTVSSVGLADAVKYATAAYKVKTSDMNVVTLSGSSVWNEETQHWSAHYYLNKAGALEDINAYANVYKEDIRIENFDARGLFADKDDAAAYEYYNSEPK